ncbi:Protein-serine/threonine phosphatase [Psidium guajava]|nr:Protein-serine/threonine phosphatase [Psidium guajava]
MDYKTLLMKEREAASPLSYPNRRFTFLEEDDDDTLQQRRKAIEYETMTEIREKEKEEGLRTVECLRGRLLAERQASRFAREQAQLMTNKLVELENQLREETQMRAKTEKKLKFLKKKLETLLISPALHEPEQSSICGTGIVSSNSSSTVTFASEAKITEEAEVESKSRFENKGASPHLELNAPEKTLALDRHDADAGDFSSEKSGHTYNEFKIDGHSCPSTRNSVTENESSLDDADQVDNSLALVPVTLAEAEPESKEQNAKMMIMRASVSEVLDALRHARESIQRSMEKRSCMIRVGPPPQAAQLC